MAKIALFDFDIITFHASAAIEKRSIEVFDRKTGRSRKFKTRTEFKTLLKSKNIEMEEGRYWIQDIQVSEPESHSFQIVKTMVNRIKQDIEADAMEGFVGDNTNNFRLKLDLPQEYKGSRKDMLRPLQLKVTKEYAVNNYPGGVVEDYEVDDHLVVRYHEMKKAGHDPVIISLDKDSKGCIGTKFYDWTNKDLGIQVVEPWGWLSYNDDKKKVEGLGLQFYAYQMLKGDTADDYSPSDLHKLRYGDKTVVKDINEAKTVVDIFNIVEEKYKEWFGDNFEYKTFDGRIVTKSYKEILSMYHSCVYMHRMKNDKTSFWDLKKEFS